MVFIMDFVRLQPLCLKLIQLKIMATLIVTSGIRIQILLLCTLVHLYQLLNRVITLFSFNVNMLLIKAEIHANCS